MDEHSMRAELATALGMDTETEWDRLIERVRQYCEHATTGGPPPAISPPRNTKYLGTKCKRCRGVGEVAPDDPNETGLRPCPAPRCNGGTIYSEETS